MAEEDGLKKEQAAQVLITRANPRTSSPQTWRKPDEARHTWANIRVIF